MKNKFFLTLLVLSFAIFRPALVLAEGIHPRGPALDEQENFQVQAQSAPKPSALAPRPKPVANPPASDNGKIIYVSLSDQSLRYYEGTKLLGDFKISSGVPGLATPTGQFTVLVKRPVVNYGGKTYSYPNTQWNLLFKKQAQGNLYIHGAYWHNNFGNPMSHGCVNVSYANMEPLYNWAEIGTKIIIQ